LKNSNQYSFFEMEKFFELFCENNQQVFSSASEQQGAYKAMADCYAHFQQSGMSFLMFEPNGMSLTEFSSGSQYPPINLLVVNGNLLYLVPQTADLAVVPIEEPNKDQAFNMLAPSNMHNAVYLNGPFLLSTGFAVQNQVSFAQNSNQNSQNFSQQGSFCHHCGQQGPVALATPYCSKRHAICLPCKEHVGLKILAIGQCICGEEQLARLQSLSNLNSDVPAQMPNFR